MPTTPVFFNFPEVSLSLQGVDCSKEIKFAIGLPITNIQLNLNNYTAYSLFIASSSTNVNTPAHLIIKCLDDIKRTDSNALYIAIPLKINTSDNRNKSVVDNIISPTTDNINFKLDLKDGGDCFVPITDTFPTMITLGTDSEIAVNTYAGKKFYPINDIGLLPEQQVSKKKNGTLKQQELDWTMSCDLVNEEGEVTKDAINPTTTATTISLFMMSILVACAAYVAGPILYQALGMRNLAELDPNRLNHYSINVFWGINMIIIAVMCLIQAIITKDTIFYFISISLIMAFFAGTSAILNDANIGDDGKFIETDHALGVYNEIVSRRCSISAFIFKIVAIIIMIYTLVGAGVFINDTIAFTIHIIAYLLGTLGMLYLISVLF